MPNWTTLPGWTETRVVHVEDVRLSVAPHRWDFAERGQAGIEAGWAEALKRNPSYFNGVIHLTRGGELSSRRFEANLFPTDFKSYLYWREGGFADQSVRDTFGSALIRSREGHVMLGRQRAGNVNGGLTYLPGGFIDARDVVTDPEGGGSNVGIDASILREAAEETGLMPSDLERLPGFHITFTGPQVSVAMELRSALRSVDLRDRMMAHIGTDPKSELTDVVVVTSRSDLADLAMPAYAQALLGALFS